MKQSHLAATGQSVTGMATDNAGNSVSLTVSGVSIDKTSPDVHIDAPSTVLLGASVTATVSASDSLSGLDVDPSGALALDTSTTGVHTVTATAIDKAGNSTSTTLTYTVSTIDGPFAPLSRGRTQPFTAGSTVPMKFQFTDGADLINTASGIVSIGAASVAFRWDDAKQQYVANIHTVSPGGTFDVVVHIDGVGSLVIGQVNLG
ncbi:MAG: hypothetical protein ACYC33_08235 [Thermoleophilia bacterium]